MADGIQANVKLAERRKNFHHPYKPYDIQLDFMQTVWDCCEQGQVGILESPTGTGKSLSLICGALSWLRDYTRRSFEGGADVAAAQESDEPQWLVEHVRNAAIAAVLGRRADVETRLAKIRAKEEIARRKYEEQEPLKKRQRLNPSEPGSAQVDEGQFLVDDYDSDAESRVKESGRPLLSAETQALLDKYAGKVSSGVGNDDMDAVEQEVRIFYCSRTHSQISQFTDELRRVHMPAALKDPSKKPSVDDVDVVDEAFKHIALGSRKNLCINPRVAALGNVTSINERCLELQQTGTSKDHRCSFLPGQDSGVLLNDFRDHAIARVRDIEDLGVLGKKIGICPYYASRHAISASEIVTLPYQLLLQRSARDALGISVKGHIVIIDEAHNLMDTIANINSVSIQLADLKDSRAQLGGYLQKFRNRLKGKNRVYLAQLVRLIDSIVLYLQSKQSPSGQPTEGHAQVSELLSGKGVDQINLYKLLVYLQESKLARKVQGYAEHASALNEPTSTKTPPTRTPTPPLQHVQTFLASLSNPSAEGRFFWTLSPAPTLKYQLLDPTPHFKELVDDARAVLLAGGTMSPLEDYTTHLLPYLPRERLATLSCGHIVPPSQLLAMPIVSGPGGVRLDFTYSNRSSASLLRSLGEALAALCASVPDGLVVFFPSYDFLDSAVSFLRSSARDVWGTISARKKVFSEPRSRETKPSIREDTLDTVLQAYATHIHSATRTDNGALLLAVIGGSLSEGINFSDRLGRGVVVVGLPFPNARAPEWQAKLAFERNRGGEERARDTLENACMRAVNQSVGRAIRHKGDFAVVVLLDARYAAPRINGKLPGWMRASLVAGGGFDGVEARVRGFFDTLS